MADRPRNQRRENNRPNPIGNGRRRGRPVGTNNAERKNTDWFITIPHYEEKTFVFLILVPICSKLLVAKEAHKTGEGHLHVYIKLLDDHKATFSEINNLIEQYVGKHANVEKVKSRKNVVRYCTKVDVDPLLIGIDNSELSFSCNAIEWIKSNPEFKYGDPFILGHGNNYRIIEKAHAEYWNGNHDGRTELNTFQDYTYSDPPTWKDKVIKWYNVVTSRAYQFKQKHLYLHGPSNTGKSTFIKESILNGLSKNIVWHFPVSEGKFAYESFKVGQHKLVYVDEMEWKDVNKGMWKAAAGGSRFKCCIKGSVGIDKIMEVPWIILSNDAPPNDAGILERLHVIKLEDGDIVNIERESYDISVLDYVNLPDELLDVIGDVEEIENILNSL